MSGGETVFTSDEDWSSKLQPGPTIVQRKKPELHPKPYRSVCGIEQRSRDQGRRVV